MLKSLFHRISHLRARALWLDGLPSRSREDVLAKAEQIRALRLGLERADAPVEKVQALKEQENILMWVLRGD